MDIVKDYEMCAKWAAEKTTKYYILYSWYLVATLEDGSRVLYNYFDSNIENLDYIDNESDIDIRERKIFGLKLKLLMKVNHINQLDLAEAIGISQSSINGYLRSLRSPSISVIRRLTRYFNVNLDDMFVI